MENTKIIGDFIISLDKRLGKGAFGSVYFGVKASDPTFKVAAKVMSVSHIEKSPNRDKVIESIKREMAILKKINNPNVVQLHSEYLTSNNIYLIFEYCKDGDLESYRQSRGGPSSTLPEGEALTFFRHICNGFKSLNAAKIIHRDIKPNNILIHEGNAKIADFGFARFTEDTDQKAFMTEVGSPLYMAPEIFCQNKYNAKCDVWSLGILLYELLYGSPPWNAKNAYELFSTKILKVPLKFPEAPKRSAKVKELITRMLTLNQDKRISWEEIFNHELVSESLYQWKELRKSDKMDEDLTESMIRSQNTLRKNLVQGSLNPVGESMELEKEVSFIDEKEKDREKEKDKKSSLEVESGSNALFKRIRDLMLYERNIAFFLKGTCHLLVSCFANALIPIEELFLYQCVFLLQKFEMVLMKYSLDLSKGQIPIEKLPTAEFFKSKEYPLFLKQITSDFSECDKTYQQVLSLLKTKATALIKKDPGFGTVLQSGLIIDQAFCKVYKETIQEFLTRLQPTFKQNTTDGQYDLEFLKLLRFLQIASTVEKPFSFFPKTEGVLTNQIFYEFYDEIAQTDEKDLAALIRRNWGK